MFSSTLKVSIKQYLTNYLGLSATKQQLEAFELLAEYLGNIDANKVFVLKGYAGTGKTTIINAVVKTLPHLKLKTVLLAPTGRAAKVVSSHTGKDSFTIHKKIYRQKSTTTLFSKVVVTDNLHENTVFIVDEASMIANERINESYTGLLDDLIAYVKKGKRCYLLFVGDTAQLPPVGVSISQALDPSLLESIFGYHAMSYELTEVVRQSKLSGILHNATELRKQIMSTESSLKIDFPKVITKNFGDIFRMNGDKLIEGLNYCYDKHGIEGTIVICRSNKSANLYNQHIRHQILFRDDEITGGDIVMIVKNNYHWLQKDDDSNTGFIANGDIAQVTKVRNMHEMHGFRFADIDLNFLDNKNQDRTISCRVILDSLHVDSPNLPNEKLQILHDSVSEDYKDIVNKTERLAAIKSDPYFNALQIKFAYAITCHKAQGGQWPAVFVDQGYMSDEMMNQEFLRWFYTAMTRATQELFLVNFSSKFFE